MTYLQIDTREQQYDEYKDCLTVPHRRLKSEAGDFLICGKDRVYAVFERKTYADYWASIKDERHDNRHKMYNLRAKTGCHVFYIIEGKKPRDSSRINIRAIENSIFRLMLENVHVVYRPSTRHTYQWLNRFVKAIDPDRVQESIIQGEYEEVDVNEAINETIAKTPEEMQIGIWMAIPGIGKLTAEKFVKESIYFYDFLTEAKTKYYRLCKSIKARRNLEALWLFNNDDNVNNNISIYAAELQKKVLMKIPSIGKKRAETLLENYRSIKDMLDENGDNSPQQNIGKLVKTVQKWLTREE